MEFSRECAHSAFEREALRRPDALAVACGDARTTYGALDQGANRLARHLREQGVGPDVLVAICMSRSPRLIESVLAVLKAGGAYVPLDPAYPPERLAFMLADARPTVVLTDAACRPLLEQLMLEHLTFQQLRVEDGSAAAGAAPVVIDCDAWAVSPGDSAPLEDIGLRAGHLAYVIYTSGSTGRPKGVMVTHRGLPSLQRVQGELFGVSPDSRVLQFASFSFDACVFEWSMALSHGASLHLGAPGDVLAGETLAALVAREGITHATLPPIVLSGLADDALGPVRVLICAGEALPPAQVKRWASGTPGRRMFNAYGPTETTIWSSVHACDPQSLASTVPIGRAIDGHSIHLLDTDGRAVAAGDTGEIHIGGIGVARGYLHRPELTAERFIDSPFVPGDRLYRTGDLARALADGTLEYLGRNDFQVKVRGHRIELGEIEAALAARADIREVVVVARDDDQGRKQLVAYYELHKSALHKGELLGGAEACPVDALRAQLADTLPAFMVPAAYVRMTVWPLTPNGKLDRRALPAPEAEAFAASAFVAPQGDTETALAAIWSELLGIERIGRDDAFLTLGGDSLKTIQLAPRIRERLGRRVAVPELFRAPTLRAMATVIDAHEVEMGNSIARDDDADAAGASFDEWRAQEAMPERCPLSYQQHGLWLLEQLTDTSLAYNAQNVIRVRGRLDPALLQRAVDAVIARHEIFRTSFHAESDGEPYQRVHPRADGVLIHEVLPPDTTDAELSARIDAHVAHRFDLTRLPLVHLTLLERSAEESAALDSVLIHIEQHYVHDGWSANLFLRELLAVYVAFAEGRQPALPAVVAQYRDYARWQRSDDAERRNAAHVAYWRRQLDGAPFSLPMQTDFPRPAVPTYRGEQLRFECSPDLSSKLRRFCEAEGVTLYAAMQAVFQIVLKTYTGSDDFLIGSAVANRRAHRSEGMLGMFVNTIAVRACVSGDPSYRALLARTMDTLSAGYEHEEVPIERVVRAMQPEREIGRNPLFQVAFSAHNSDVPTLHGPGFALNLYEAYSNRTSKFDFDVVMIPRGFDHADSVTLLWTYAQDLYRRETIERLRDSYLRVLDQCLAAPDAPLSALDALSPEERASAMDGDCTLADYDLDRPAHAWFEAQAARAPHALAASCDGDAINYGALNARANQLAHALRERGIGPGVLVGICMQRSIAWIASVLAVLKAGGAYVPMDPGYPGDRLRDMLVDAEPAVVLTDAHGAAVLTAAMAAQGDAMPAIATAAMRERLIAIDADGAQWADWPAHDIAPAQIGLAQSHPAYVIYTSGSTGRPKGVLVPHRGVANLLQAQADLFAVSPDSRVLQFASFSFDACVFEWLMALSHGASLHMPAPGVVLIGDALESFVAQAGITHALLPPVVLSALPETATLPGLRVLISGGEAMPQALVQRWAPGRALFNAYGPTEDSVVSTVHRCDPAADTGASVPIGRGLPNHRTYVLDAHRRTVPTGVPGELYVGGVGVALGYLNRPELTAERFIDGRLIDSMFIAGERLYRTGDLVRRRADGALDYLGRNDFQVKIRGYRIELGEIEARLAALPAVQDAVVLARQDAAGQPARLVAYYRCAQTGEVTAETLRAALQAGLPEYMVPSAYVEMAQWPLTANGKLDRKALPAPDADAYAGRAAYEAPATQMEIAMADLWTELLGVERVGRHDNFFALGGHSLLGVRLVMRVRRQLGLDIAPNTLFASPTLVGFSAHAAARQALVQGGLVQDVRMHDTIPRVPRGETLASHAQQRLWFLSRMGGAIDAYHIARAVELRGDLDEAALRWALDRLIARHESLRTTFGMVDGALHQRIGPPTAFALETHDLSGLGAAAQAAALQSLQQDETAAPFDLERGPLLRGGLIRLDASRRVLLLTMHHIVSDGWSMAIFARELEALYASRRAGGEDPLPALPVQYADYAAWQRARLQGEHLAQEGDYWREALRGAPSLLTLPTDHRRPPDQDYRGALLDVHLDAALTQRLKKLALRHGATLYMTLLAAWSVVLSRLSGQTDVVVGTPVANRDRGEIEDLIGFFVNTLPVRLTLDDAPTVAALTVADLIAQAKDRVLQAQAHQDLPFEQVVELVNPTRSLGHSPIFQAMFAWQNNASDALHFEGLETLPLRLPHAISKFDLTLGLGESEDGGIVGEIEYATALFDEATIARHATYLRQVLIGMTAGQADGGIALSQLDLLPPEEAAALVEGGLHPEPYDLGRTLHAWFEDRAAQMPDAPALVCETERLSFGELNADANRLARALRAAGVAPDGLVGICMANGSGALLSVLAVLKSGGAYVPLDPEYPADRIDYMLQDAKPAVVLTDGAGRPLLERILAAMPEDARPQVIDLQVDAERWRSLPAENLASNGVTPQHLAYVIYTSGSTGRPKGVMIEHRSAANLWHESRRQVLPGERPRRVGLNASLSFDASVQSWLQLLSGHCVVVIPQHVRKDPGLLAAYLRAHRVEVFDCTPMQLEWLQPRMDAEDTARTEAVLVGGEAINPAQWRAWAAWEGVRLYNAYGPTECTVDSTLALIVGDAPFLGHPLANVRAYVLDENARLVPSGVVGELYLGGAGLARGYLNRPDLTAERFIYSPFIAGERLYRTGDLARRRADGVLTYEGRNDFQVKIRGYRIELGEIESKLIALPGVKDAVVLAREDVPAQDASEQGMPDQVAAGAKRLVAYFIADNADEAGTADVDGLRAQLKAQLPDYMVPTAYVPLAAWPLTSNGKLDRKALPAPDAHACVGRTAYEAPRTPMEQAMAGIWSQVLGVERVGIRDNFFDLGGHSLMAMRLIMAVQDMLGVDVSLRDLFEGPTIEQMLAVIFAQAEEDVFDPA